MTSKVITKLPAGMTTKSAGLVNKTIGVIGYGNQGKSQAQNLRDSGFKVQIGNIKDDYAETARRDGFKVRDIASVAKTSDVLLFLLPDEIQPEIFERDIKPNLKAGQTLVFASGYNYFFDYVKPKSTINVLMLAPAMIGWGVRERYVQGGGFPVLIAVGHDHTGDSHEKAMVLAKALGAFMPGGCVIESSFKEETLLDLLSEHTWAGAVLYTFRAFYDVVKELGFSGEAAILEMYASGELADIAKLMEKHGLFNSLQFHSHTSQYGQYSRGPDYVPSEAKAMMKKAALQILDGTFAKEWTKEQKTGMKNFERLKKENRKHPMEKDEEKLYKVLGRNESS